MGEKAVLDYEEMRAFRRTLDAALNAHASDPGKDADESITGDCRVVEELARIRACVDVALGGHIAGHYRWPEEVDDGCAE